MESEDHSVKFHAYLSSPVEKGPLFVMHHGAGSSGLSFALVGSEIRKRMPNAGIFGLMDRDVVEEFNRLPERNRFIPGLRLWLGFEQATVYYDRAARAMGKPKQTLSRLIAYAANGIVSFSYRPLRSLVGPFCAQLCQNCATF